RAEINGHSCAGPLATVLDLTPSACVAFGWRLNADGSGLQISYTDAPITWSALEGADQGRLRVERTNNRRGWQVIQRNGSDFLLLENASFDVGAAPPDFERSTRLTRFTRIE